MGKAGPDPILPERAPTLWTPLRFFLAGVASMLVLLLVALYRAPLLAADFLHNPATLAVTHLFTLGFGSTVVAGALYQMVPVLLHSRLASERVADLHLLLHLIGTAMMVQGFLDYTTTWVITGGSLVLAGALLLAGNLVLTFRRAERWNWHGAFLPAAILLFLSTLTWGIVLAVNQRDGFMPRVEGTPLTGHLVLGLLGWFSLMIAAVGMKLVPMFAPGAPLPTALTAGVGGALLGGVLVMLAGLAVGAGGGGAAAAATSGAVSSNVAAPGVGPGQVLFIVGALLAGGALLTYAGAALHAYKKRRPGPLDLSVRFALTAALLLPLSVALLPLAGRQARAGLVLFFAFAFVGGTILGMLLRIIPFMVWLHRFRHRLTRQERIPFLHEMFRPRWGWIAYAAWFPGAALLAAGLGLTQPWLVLAGAVVELAALGGFGAAVGEVLTQVRPGSPPRYPGARGSRGSRGGGG